jgi:Protein of unknown function, DUF481
MKLSGDRVSSHMSTVRCRAHLGFVRLLALVPSGLGAQAAGWEQSVQVSANAWYGAAQARVIATEFGVSRTDSTVTVRSDLHLGYADDRTPDGPRRVTARGVRASLGLDYRPFHRYSPFAFGSFESSLQQRIARRYNVGVGAKLTLHRKDRDDLSVSLALLEERTRALAGPDTAGRVSRRTRWSLRFRYRRQVTPSVFFSHVTFYQPAVSAVAERYLVDANTSIEAALTAVLSLTGTLRHRYDSEARLRGAASNTDGQVLIGVRARL